MPIQANITGPSGTQTGDFNVTVTFAVAVTDFNEAKVTIRPIGSGNGITGITFAVSGSGMMYNLPFQLPEDVTGSFKIEITGMATRDGGSSPEAVISNSRTVNYDNVTNIAVTFGTVAYRNGGIVVVPVTFAENVVAPSKTIFDIARVSGDELVKDDEAIDYYLVGENAAYELVFKVPVGRKGRLSITPGGYVLKASTDVWDNITGTAKNVDYDTRVMNMNVPQFDSNLIREAIASTVLLVMNDRNNNPISLGSGFFVLSNTIATNYHVIEGAARGTVNLVGMPKKYTIDGILAIDKDNDLALLKVSASSDIKPLTLINDSETVEIGEAVFAVGNPEGLEGTLSVGIISNLHSLGDNKRLQMAAPISPGSSGGPVLNTKGEVIGIAVGSRQALGAQNLNFAIPSNYLKELLNRSESTTPLLEQEQSISAETYYVRGNIKFKQGDYFGAITDFDEAIQLKPNYAEAYNNRGLAKHELGEHAAALIDFDRAIQLKPELSVVYNNRALAKHALGEPHSAIADYDKAIQLKDDDAGVFRNRGYTKDKLGEHAEALADYDKAIQLKPDFADAYNDRGYTKDKLGEHAAALIDFDRAIQLKPDFAEAYNNRGFAKYNLKDFFAAITNFDKAIQLKPDYPNSYNNRGLVKTNLNQHVAAITDYNIAIQLKPDYADAYFNRGVSYLELGLLQNAIPDFLIALRFATQTGNTELRTVIDQFLRDFI